MEQDSHFLRTCAQQRGVVIRTVGCADMWNDTPPFCTIIQSPTTRGRLTPAACRFVAAALGSYPPAHSDSPGNRRGNTAMTINRSFVSGMIVGGALFGAGMISTAKSDPQGQDAGEPAVHEQTITAGRVNLVDENGTVVMALGANDRGGSLSIRDDFGRTIVIAGATADGGAIMVNESRSGSSGASLRATARGGECSIFAKDKPAVTLGTDGQRGWITIEDTAGKGLCNIGVSEQGDGRFLAESRGGTMSVSIGGDATGGGLIETFTAAGPRLVTLGATTAGHGRIDTFSPSGRPLITMTASEAHEAQLYLFDSEGHRMSALAASDIGPAFVLFNAFDEPVVTLGSTEDGKGEINVLDREKNGRRIAP